MNSATGPTEPYGGRAIKQEQLFVEHTNESGGFQDSCGNSYTLDLTVFDMSNQADQAVAGFRQASDDPSVSAVFGPTSDVGYLPLIPLAGEAKLPLLIPSAGSHVFNWNPYAYRIGPDVEILLPAVLGKLQQAVGMTSMAVLTDQTQNSNVAQAQLLQNLLPQLGVSLTTAEVFTGGDVDFRAQLTKIKATNPDWLYVNGNAGDNAQIVNQASELGLTSKIYMASTTNIFPDAWDATQGKVAGTYSGAGGVVGGNITPHEPAAVDLYTQKYSEPPHIYAMWGWDAGAVTVDAIKRACSADREKIAAELGKTENFALSNSGTITWQNPPSGENQTPAFVVIKATGRAEWEAVE